MTENNNDITSSNEPQGQPDSATETGITQAEADRRVRLAVEKQNEKQNQEKAELAEKNKALQAQLDAERLTADEISAKKAEEQRAEFQTKIQTLEQKNKSYFTRQLLAEKSLPVSDEIVAAYIPLNEEAIKNSIEQQAKLIEQKIATDKQNQAINNAPTPNFTPNQTGEEDAAII